LDILRNWQLPIGISAPVVAESYDATGKAILLFSPSPFQAGADVMMVEATGLDFIQGRFSNLAQGQKVNLYDGHRSHPFVANYYGGTGNDLVLHWAAQEFVGWGRNDEGQLGNGNTEPSSALVNFTPKQSALDGRTVVATASGEDHHLALCSDGALVSWGQNNLGQLGNASGSYAPGLVDRSGVLSGKVIVSIAAGCGNSLVLCSDGSLISWGSNFCGELGTSTAPHRQSVTPVLVDQDGALAGKRVIQIAAAASHCLALCSDGSVISWGEGATGQSYPGGRQAPGPVNQNGVLAGKTVVAISTGDSTSFAVCSDGTVAGWGQNQFGQLGNGTSGETESTPVLVKRDGVLAGRTVVSVSAGDFHTVALCSDGTLATWGYNSHGTLGNGTSASSNVPTAVNQTGILAGKTVVSVTGHEYQTRVMCSDGTLVVWGDGDTVPVSAMQGIFAGRAVTQVFARFATLADSTLIKFEGSPSQPSQFVTPQPVLLGKTVVSLAAGDTHNLTLCADGTLATWGESRYLFAGTAPVQVRTNGVLAGKSVIAISAAGGHNLALCSDGTIAAWGENYGGQLGDGSNYSAILPIMMDQSGALAGKKVVAVEAGTQSSYALCSDGTLFGWGNNHSGELGDGTNIQRTRPVPVFRGGVMAGKSIVSIASRSGHSIVLCSDGTLATSGVSGYRSFGIGDPQVNYTTVLVDRSGVLLGKTVISVKALDDTFVLLCSDGTVASLAKNTLQQLADGSALPRNVPLQVNTSGALAGKNVVQITTGGTHCIARCSDGTLATWGTPSIFTSSPVPVPQLANFPDASVTSISSGGSHNLAIVSKRSTTPVISHISAGVFGISFDPAVTSYKITVPHDTENLFVWISYNDSLGSVSLQNKPLLQGQTGEFISLRVGANQIVVSATVTDGSVTDYTLQVDRESASWDSTLGTLTIGGADLSPAFSSLNLNYSATVSNEVSSVDMNAFPSYCRGSLVLNGQNLNYFDAALPLQVGTNEFRIKVLAENGIHYSIYHLKIVRRAVAPDLLNFATSSGPLAVAFSPTILTYQLRVPPAATSTTVTPNCSDPAAVLKVNGVVVASGSPSKVIPLTVGLNLISISVEDVAGFSPKTYTLTVMRELPPNLPNAILSGLTLNGARLSPAFQPATSNYSAKVAHKIRSVKLTATALSGVTTITVNGTSTKLGAISRTIPLSIGRNLLKIRLMGKDGSTKSYKIVITRLPARTSSNTPSSFLVTNSAAVPRDTVSTTSSSGYNHLQIRAAKRHDGSIPKVEVSANLVDWFSGDQHTLTLVDDRDQIVVQDKTPRPPQGKRFIRLRWLTP
jgi:alpha-tubulin suppressor-like RCC1 family protein